MENEKRGNFSVLKWLMGYLIAAILEIPTVLITSVLEKNTHLLKGIEPGWLRFVFPSVLVLLLTFMVLYSIQKRNSRLDFKFGMFWDRKLRPFCPSCPPFRESLLKTTTNPSVMVCPRCGKYHQIIGDDSRLYTYISVKNYLQTGVALEEYKTYVRGRKVRSQGVKFDD